MRSALTLQNVGFVGSLYAPPVGGALPALNWLARFDADTGLANQVSGGNPLVPGVNAPVLTANVYGSRKAWVLTKEHPDYFDLTVANPVAQHWLVACVFTITSNGQNGAMLLGSNTPQFNFWQTSSSNGPYYGQGIALAATSQDLDTPLVAVFYVGTDGNEHLWLNGTVYDGGAATAVAQATIPLQIGKWVGGMNWEMSGPYGSLNIAGNPAGFAAADAAAVGTYFRNGYNIP